MKGFLIALAIGFIVIGGGFAALLAMAEAGAPETSEIRMDVSDEHFGGR